LKAILLGVPSTETFNLTLPKSISSGRICSKAATLSPLLQAKTIEGLAPLKSQLQAIYGSPSNSASNFLITIVQGGRIFRRVSAIFLYLFLKKFF